MENTAYDPELIQRLANKLYAQARTIAIWYTLFGAVILSFIFYFTASIGHSPVEILGIAPVKSMGVGLLIGVVLGFVLGQRKSSQLKLASQLALCQLKIEKNTRS